MKFLGVLIDFADGKWKQSQGRIWSCGGALRDGALLFALQSTFGPRLSLARVLKHRVCVITYLVKCSFLELYHSPTLRISDAGCQMRKRYSKKWHGVRQSRRLFVTAKATGAPRETSWFQECSPGEVCNPRCWSFPKQMDLALFEVHTCRCWQTSHV